MNQIDRAKYALAGIARTTEGRFFLRTLLDLCGLYAPSDLTNLPYEAGKRAVALSLIAALNEIDPRLFALIASEAADDATRAAVAATDEDI